MKTPLSKEMLFTYFSGQATILQKQLIEEWLAGQESQEMYFEWLQEWENSHPQFLPDVDSAFERMQELLEAEEYKEEQAAVASRTGDIRNGFGTLGRWAAAAVVISGFTAYLFRDVVFYENYRTGYAENRTLALPDGSTVALHPNSGLKMLRWGFGWFNRDVALEGEASFVVTHRADNQPFTVHTPDHGKVTVLGTEFFVYSREKGTQVVLSKGKVRISSPEMAAPLDMEPGEKASIESTGEIDIQPLTTTERANPASWQEHHFRFDHTSLFDVTRELHSVFGLQTVIDDPSLAARQVTGTFKARQADELLSVLAEMLEMTVEVRSGKVYLVPDSLDTN
ncbi:FecR domain-containing protein [Dyadobacter sp. 676]|uniref:FecR domain-containing protein n=1 Tax=Dyadobacter sp. 676 TaxID=3088362 RepID=A0AAU8FNC2_9BACT